MNRFCYRSSLVAICALLAIVALRAEPAPIVVQAMTPAPAGPAAKPAAAQDNGSLQSAIKSLEQIKATNQETLKRQQTVLDQLDELQKSAEQMKIFTKRG